VNIGASGPFWACEISVSPVLLRRAKYSAKPWLETVRFLFSSQARRALAGTLRRSLPSPVTRFRRLILILCGSKPVGPRVPWTPARPARPTQVMAVASCNKLVPATLPTPFRERLTFAGKKTAGAPQPAQSEFSAQFGMWASRTSRTASLDHDITPAAAVSERARFPMDCDRDSHEAVELI
jgi:hypothetical protein